MSADFPQSWLRVLLNNVGEIVTGKTPSTKNPDNFGGNIPFIKPADLDNGGYVTLTADTLTDAGAKLVPTIPPNSIPVTCIGNLGKVGITNQTSATNQQINTVVPSSQVDYRFFYYQLQTLKPWMQENASATTVTIINKGKFSKAPVTLPPLAEQNVIADKLDTLLAQVENTKARLERIPQTLKLFRQSVLAAAVSGRLTEEWRGDCNYTDLEVGDEIVPIPLNWSSSDIGGIIDGSRKLCYGVIQPGPEVSGGTPLIRVCDIQQGEIDWRNLRSISLKIDDQYRRSKVKRGDILVTIVGAIGRVGIVRNDNDANIARAVARVSPNESLVHPFYVHCWLSSPTMQWWLVNSSKEVARKTLNLKELITAPIPLPPLVEQTEIVRRIDQLFAHADRIEQQVNNALARVNNLTQSILAKAFRGELTEQWRKDNPELISGQNSAEALLERIKAERAVAAAKPKLRSKQ